MTHSQIEEILTAVGWEKLLRKDHLMLFRKYDNDLQVYSYKSKKTIIVFILDQSNVPLFSFRNIQ